MSDTARRKPAWPLFLCAALAFVPGLGILFGSLAATWALLSSRPRALVAFGIAAGGALLQIVSFALWIAFSEADPGMAMANLAATQQDLRKVVNALDAYHAKQGSYPASLQELQRSGLTTRFVNIYDQSAGVFHLPYTYQYRVAADGSSFDVFSAGPDRAPETADDIRPVLPDSVRTHSGYRPPG